MILILLPILDLLTASVLILHTNFNMFPGLVLLVHGSYLTLKGLLFAKGDFASRIDVVCGVYVILVGLGLFSNKTVALVVFIWLVQKAVFALIPMR